MKRGEAKAVYTEDAVVLVWKDNQPVYMASNCDQVEPMGQCQRYNRTEKGYKPIPQPHLNMLYNRSMGGVDLLDNSQKNYAITTRVKNGTGACTPGFCRSAWSRAGGCTGPT
jgi:hypothetical protein